jgi:hypothetical protein
MQHPISGDWMLAVRHLEISALPLEGGHGRFIGAVAMFWETKR